MPRRKPTRNGSSHLRRSIATAAARLMAEEGIDYGTAKRKAAVRFGARETESLPTNEEIEQELRTYHALYQEDEQPELLQTLRHSALDLMAMLEAFRPHLCGAVLDGTAGRYSSIHLMLYADSSKEVEIWLLSHGISYQTEPLRSRRPQDPETRLTLDWEGAPVQLDIYQSIQLRNRPLPLSANRSAVEALLNENRP